MTATAMQFPTGDDQPHYEVVDITPDLAREMLTRNTHNRNLRFRVVSAYAADMANGDWTEDGQSIKFAKDGALLDGQHRLAAIIEADATVRMLVVRGLDPATQDNMDTQAKRTFGDVLKLRGETNYASLAAIVRRVHLWEAGIRHRGGNLAPTTSQMLQTLDTHPWLRESTVLALTVRRNVPLPVTIVGLSHWLFTRIDDEDSTFFFQRLTDGLGLLDGDPVLVLRKLAFRDAGAGSRTDDVLLLAYVIKAWNAYREGRQIQLLKYRPGGAKPEAFPVPK